MENKPLQNPDSSEISLLPEQKKDSDHLSGADKEKKKSSKPGRKPAPEPPADGIPSVPVNRWFVTLMCMNIPIIGWIYLIALAFRRSAGPRRDFAKAYLLYKLVFLLLSLGILAVALHYGLQLLDQILAYMEML